jgi:hypothetical protein
MGSKLVMRTLTIRMRTSFNSYLPPRPRHGAPG